ncbi:hypothetical protein E4U31_005996, partial [Claviceps sp. LM219 group G6]
MAPLRHALLPTCCKSAQTFVRTTGTATTPAQSYLVGKQFRKLTERHGQLRTRNVLHQTASRLVIYLGRRSGSCQRSAAKRQKTLVSPEPRETVEYLSLPNSIYRGYQRAFDDKTQQKATTTSCYGQDLLNNREHKGVRILAPTKFPLRIGAWTRLFGAGA